MKVVAVLVCFITLLAYAKAYQISVIPQWGSCQGAVNPNSCSFTTITTTSPVTQKVSWGQPQQGQPQSAVALQGPTVQSVTAGDYVLLSQISHYNYIVDNADLIPQSIGVSWQANLKDGSTDLGTFTFGGNLQVNETLNAPDNSVPCPYKNNWLQYGKVYTNSLPCCPFPTETDNPCSDAIIAVLNPNNNPPIEPKGTTLSFQMVIAGFCDKPTPDGCSFATNFAFISQEQKINTKYLFGQLIVKCSNTGFCQNTASQLNGICQIGTCNAGKCDFSADPNNLGKACTPGTGANSPCMKNFICVPGTNNTGGCQGTKIPPQQPCSNGQTNTGNVCTYFGCSSDGTSCYEWPRAINSQCNSGSANTSCSSYTCQGKQGSSNPACQISPAQDGTPCSDNIAVPNGKDGACVAKGCVNGVCGYYNANEGQSCGNPATCNTASCRSGVCTQQRVGNYQTAPGCSGSAGTGDSCATRYCLNGACSTGFANMVGQQCGASGNCFTQTCDANDGCKRNVLDDRSACSASNIPVCNRGGCQNGNCVAVVDDSQSCTQPYRSCYTSICSGGACRYIPVGAGTNYAGRNNCTTTASVGPCQYTACDGNGGCNVRYRQPSDPNPCTGSPNQCSKYGCTGSSPDCQPISNGVRNCNDVPNQPSTGIAKGDDGSYCKYGTCDTNSLTCTLKLRSDNAGCRVQNGVPALSVCQSAFCSSGECVAINSNDASRCPAQACKATSCTNGQCIYTNRANGTDCRGNSGASGIDYNCQAELCNNGGECKLWTYADYTPCPGTTAGVCRSFHCSGGKCGAGIDLSQNCTYSASSDPPTLSQCNTFKCQNDASCKPSPDDTLSCSRTGNPGTCMQWGCRNGSCVAVPVGGSPSCDPGASRDQCKAYTCNNGQCVGTVTPNISCNYQGTLPPCNAAFCTASGACGLVAVPDNGSCTDNLNPCNVQICSRGQCVRVSQEGKFCNTGGDGFCFYSQCKGTVCTPIPRNENRPCAGGRANVTGDAYCQTPICIQGVCAPPGSYFDNATCAVSFDKCKYNRCVRGTCDPSQDFPVAAGSDCSRGTVSECILQLCDGLGECVNTAPDSKPCYKPATNYKKRAAIVPNQCQAYTCSSAVCTPSIQNVDGIPCVLNLTALNITIASPCLSGICLNAQCNPAINVNCSTCARFKTCDTCLGGNYALKRAVDVCATNPSLPECKLKCNWCQGKCLDSDLVNSYNTFYPPGSAANLQCTGVCPVALVAEQSSSKSDALAVGLAVGLGGGFVLLAALAALAIVLIIVVKRKLRTPDANMATTAFVDNVGANNNPVHVPTSEVKNNPTFGS